MLLISEIVDTLNTLSSEISEAVQVPPMEMPSLPVPFMSGGVGGMCIISLFLVALFFAAWKAPRWVKEIGLCGLTSGFAFGLVGLWQMFHAIQHYDDTPFSVICGGLQAILISIIYGLIVFFVSLVIRIIQKPRI